MVIVIPPAATKVNVSLLLSATTVDCPDTAIFLNMFCCDPLSVLVNVPLVVIVPPDKPVLVAILVTVPVLLDVPAPINERTSAAVIPEFNEGVLPLLNIAGVPVSLTTPKLVLAAEAVLAPVPPFATDKSVPDQFPLLILTDPPKVIVPVEVIVPPVNVIPFTVPLVPTDVTPALLDVPAPIRLLTSAAVTPLANVGEPPPLNIPGSAKVVYPL